MESLERDLARAGQESRAQSARAESLQQQLDGCSGGSKGRSGSAHGRRGSGSGGGGSGSAQALNGFDDMAEGVATADIMALKVKATQLVERLRQEKTTRLKAERKTQRVAGKVWEGKECFLSLVVYHLGGVRTHPDNNMGGSATVEAGGQTGRQSKARLTMVEGRDGRPVPVARCVHVDDVPRASRASVQGVYMQTK